MTEAAHGPSENPRAARTRQRVRQALLSLLEDKRIYRISIRELCALAGINRSTFYNHYGSQYDVLADMANAYLDSIARALDAADVRDKQNVRQRVTLVLQYAQDNLALSRMLLDNSIDPTFSQRLFSLPKVEEMLAEALAPLRDEAERRAVVAFVIHGSYRLIQDWINDENRPAPAAQARRILTLAGRACQL